MRKQAMKKNLSVIGFVIVTAVLVLITAYFCVEIVKGVTDVSAQELELFYLEKEEVLVQEAKDFLNREGFTNSGIMLTRVVEADGSRQYTLTVHHGRIDRMSEEERADLMEELEKIVFVDENCNFFHEFLINE